MFVPETLANHGHEVDIFWDEAWTGGEPILWEKVAASDVVIMFQSYCPTDGRTLRSLHPNVIYIPMFDQFGIMRSSFRHLAEFWQPFEGSKVLSFSSSVHAWASGFGIASHLARFYPEVPAAHDGRVDGLHGFFWLRREMELGWNVVRTLIGSTPFQSFHVHVAGDPGFPPVQRPAVEELQAEKATVSTWFEDRRELDDVLRNANVYFAPRLTEGIGQSFLEAMGRGQCVVAADNPTMNEYIVHGVNGILYDPQDPSALDFSEVARLGEEARRGLMAGRKRWLETEEALVRFILTPSADLYGDDDKNHIDLRVGQPADNDAPPELPRARIDMRRLSSAAASRARKAVRSITRSAGAAARRKRM